jgi:D-glycero-D-manno-heptose 1,7-bisphosphate phosphatase
MDRDGVINHMVYDADHGLIDSPQNAAQFELLPGAAEAVRAINDMGWLAIVVSNQPGIAKNKCHPTGLAAITARMHDELGQADARLDGVYYCLHHPDAVLDEYRVVCDCRKPQPGLLCQAAEAHDVDLGASFMIGDGLTDVLAGRAAGCRTILLGSLRCDVCRTMDERGARPDHYAASLAEAIRLIQNMGL